MLTSKHFWINLVLVLSAVRASAFMTPPARVIRNQPWKLAREKPFRVEGTLRFGEFSAQYFLSWVSPGNYELQLNGIPKSIYANEAVASDEWRISRKQGRCTIKTSTQIVSCGGSGLWGTVELSARAEAVVEALVQAEIIRASDAGEVEINSKDSSTLKISEQQKLTIGKNHGVPTAYIELRGERINRDAAENPYPVIQYDQTFLAPRLLRIKSGDDILTVEASGELDIDKEQPRQSFVLSEKLVVKNQKDQQLTMSRKEPLPLPPKFQLLQEKTLFDQSILNDALTFEGQFLLSALLFTH